MANINLNNFKVITDKLNTYFVNNKFMVGEEMPVEGDYIVGDIIINVGETNVTEPMWICVESGNPGIWTVFNSGGSSSGSISSFRGRTTVNQEVSEVVIAVSGFNKATDVLLVFANSKLLVENVDYTINSDSTKILPVNENWNEELMNDFIFDFIVFKMINDEGISSANEIVVLKNNVIVNNAVDEVEIGIEGFNADGDLLTVFKNSVYMIEGIDYSVSADSDSIICLNGQWNEDGDEGYIFTFEVMKTVAKINPDAVVGMEHLKDDVKEAIEEASNIDISGKQDVTDEELITNDKTIVGAINELFISANNGKQLIADAIGEPLDSSDTFSAMSGDINSLLSTFKINMMNNGVTVESSDKFKALIDKIATLADSEGKGVQCVSGIITPDDLVKSDGDYYNDILVQVDYDSIGFVPDIVIINPVTNELSPVNSNFPVYHFKISYSNIGTIPFCFLETEDSSDEITNGRITMVNYNYVNETGFGFKVLSSISSYNQQPITKNHEWYAIGVGEDDTTLRDSLASILTDEGVEVTDEDDMASLITKTDEEFESMSSEIDELEDDIESARSTLADLMLEGGYDISGDEDIDSLLELLTISGISVSDIKQIACGMYYTFILKNDGSVYSCGYNDYGQLGQTSNRTTFTQVTTNINNDVKQISCGYNHTFILKNDGSVYSCGNNGGGQLGLGDTTNRTSFTQVTTNIDNDVEQIICGWYHTFILKNDGSVYSCGSNYYGQLGLGTSDEDAHSTFTQVTTNINNDVTQIACGWHQTFILKNDGSVYSCGYNGFSQLGLGNEITKTTFTQVTTNINNDVKQIACGENYTFILKNDGSVYSCGYNGQGGLGLGDTATRTTFTQVTTNINNDVEQIVCGGLHTFILKNDGSVYSCGYNEYGQLGLGDTTDRTSFTKVTSTLNDFKQISCGGKHTFILKNDGSVYSCGYNDYSQLGLGDVADATNIPTFTQVTTNIKEF